MNPEVLRVGLYALGSLLVFVGGLDDALVAMSLPALGLLSASVAKVIAMAGAGLVGYARTARSLGDFKIADIADKVAAGLTPVKPETK